LDLGMLFYIFLFAINQDTHHQLAWGRSLALYLLLDITFISSFTVIFYHVLLPMMIHRDVQKIKKKLSESVRDYCCTLEKKKEKELEEEEEKELHEEDDEDDYDFGFELDEDDDDDDDELDMDMLQHRKEKTKSSANVKEDNKHNKNEEEKKQLPFDAVKYLFVSYRMAQLYAEDAGLPAAQLILNYSSPWPKQSYLRTVNLKGDFSESYTAVTRAISIVVIFFLTNLLATPIAIQDMILQMVTTVTFGYTLLVHIQLYAIFPALVIVPTSALLAISVYLRQWWLDRKKKNRMKKMKQVFPPEKKSDRCNRDIMGRGEPLIKGDENDDNANNEENDFNIDELSSDEDETGRKQTFRSREPETTNKSLFDTRNTSKSKRGRGKRRRNLSINRRQSLKQGLQITSQIQRQLEALAEEEAEEEENKSSELSFVLDETGDDHEEDELDELSLSISSETIHSSDEAKQEL
jgi:low affinity Fe/Cu permease